MTAVERTTALARLSASIQKSSSTRLSLAGNAVPWTRKTSLSSYVFEHTHEQVALREPQRFRCSELTTEVLRNGATQLLTRGAGEQQEVIHLEESTHSHRGEEPWVAVSQAMSAQLLYRPRGGTWPDFDIPRSARVGCSEEPAVDGTKSRNSQAARVARDISVGALGLLIGLAGFAILRDDGSRWAARRRTAQRRAPRTRTGRGRRTRGRGAPLPIPHRLQRRLELPLMRSSPWNSGTTSLLRSTS